MHGFVDDGHAIKLWRAVFVGKAASAAYEDRDWLRIKGGLWDQIGRIIVDAVEAPGPTWVRNAGFEEAWKVSYAERASSPPLPPFLCVTGVRCRAC